MKRAIRQSLAAIIILALTLCSQVTGNSAVAAGAVMKEDTTACGNVYVAKTGSEEELSPRMKYLSSVFTDLSLIGNRANCQGNYTTFKNVRVTLTVTLQRCSFNATDDEY